MNVIPTKLSGVSIIEPKVFGDERGFFMETWNQARYQQAGIPGGFVQDNISFSKRGVLRGLHYQNPKPQAKLVYVLIGEVYDVAVDIRYGSDTFGQWVGVRLSAGNKRQLYVPEGYAHGFCVVSDEALFTYKCSDFYNPDGEGAILWNDPDIGIQWPIDTPTLAAKDAKAPRLRDVSPERLKF